MALPTIAATAVGNGAAATTGNLSSTLAVVSGQVVVVLVAQTAAARDLTVTDDQGHTWTTQQTATNSRRAHIVTTVSTYTGNITITTGWSASATWQAYAAAINDADGGAAVDVSDQLTQTALSCFAAASTALDTAANVLVFSVYSCAVTRSWTETYTSEGKGTGYLFQSKSSATALTDERSPATQTGGGAIASAAASISVKGSAGGGGGGAAAGQLLLLGCGA
jgi:hypothetical protein